MSFWFPHFYYLNITHLFNGIASNRLVGKKKKKKNPEVFNSDTWLALHSIFSWVIYFVIMKKFFKLILYMIQKLPPRLQNKKLSW